MYRALLVDDEDLDLYGLTHFIPWDRLGIVVAASVNSGYAAMSVLEHEQIDILVTDIRMPNMTGLELARKASALWPNMQTIFVSGVQDFHYAKEALTLNAANYVLKPVDDDELTRSLERVVDALNLSKERDRMETAYMQLAPMAHRQWLLEALEGSADVNDAGNEAGGVEPPMLNGRIAVVEIDDIAWKIAGLSEEERSSLSDSIGYWVERSKEAGCVHLCRIAPHRLAVVLEEAPAWLKLAIEGLGHAFPVTATVGIGGSFERLGDIGRSYREALKALSCKWFEGKGRIIEIGNIRHMELENAHRIDIRLDALFTAITRHEPERIRMEVDDLFGLARRSGSKLAVNHFVARVLIKLDDYLAGLNTDLFALLDIDAEQLDELNHYETVEDLRTWFLERFLTIADLLNARKQRKNRKLIEEVMAYVTERIGEQLTLRDVGNHFSYSHNYIGQLFREETGSSFTDFVIQVRLEKARDLLQHSNLKIYEISERVGYSNLTYFSKQFKECYGVSPGEYRKQCG
ncbi:helix-turn-helix domain-containing protein [Cohnella soli]|uniref:Helix-turn-helix domain-containing protein n=1 Tax=Cohnella soli TaxID=425005 RepID=A0ABW0HX19_9BACL